ncbi:MAG TPA: ABC transporter permease [Bryobacteraceae bacterium]|nr:ABC transporter permease [Bryobacteraceae bacterium]
MGLLADLRFALRALIKNRGMTAIALASLALGTGANTAIFTMVNAVMLRSLSVEDPSALAAVSTVDARSPGLLQCSYPNYVDYRDRNHAFSSLALYTTLSVNLTGHGDPQLLMAQLVTGNYFSTLGVKPVVGRSFRQEEDATPGVAPVAVLSYGLWARQFGSDPAILSRTIHLNGRTFDIIGVAPPDFRGLNMMFAADLWVPIMMYPQLYPNPAWVTERRALIFAVAGRLRRGVTRSQAEIDLGSVAEELERLYPVENGSRRVRLTSIAQAALAPETRAVLANGVAVLMTISGLVLLIACSNVANLLLAQAAGRGQEISVRLALGASRWRLVRQLLTESVLLALTGGIAGLLFARWTRDVIWGLRPPILAHAGLRLDLDGRILMYTLLVSLATGFLFGLAPALRATRTDLAASLRERSATAAVRVGGWNLRSAIVVGQVTFAMVTLIGAGLFLRSIWNAGRIDPGFDAAHLGIVAFNVANQGYDEARGREYQKRALELASGVPGVTAAALAKDAPFHVSGARTVLVDGPEQNSGSSGRYILATAVGPGYFQTVGIPLLRGRDIGDRDTAASPHVAIINDAASAYFWPGEDPIGKRLYFAGDRAPAEVIGVVRNANYQAIGERPQAFLYLALAQYYFPTAVLHIRTAGDPAAMALAVGHALQSLDRNLLLQPESTSLMIRDTLWAQRLSAGLLLVFGALALALSIIGIYGVISYTVHQRTREIGLRMALGATSGDVQRMVVREGIRLVAFGVVLGLAAALAASRTVESMLFVVSARDAMTFILVPAILTLVAIVACWMPARRAARIDPSIALRNE